MKKNILILTICLSTLSTAIYAQVDNNGELMKYKRSSLYSVLLTHSDLKFSDQIATAFGNVPIPDKFNDHNLTVRQFESTAKKVKHHGKEKDSNNTTDIEKFISDNLVSNELIAKWFNRNSKTGGFDMSLIQERGFYNASRQDISAAEMSDRGLAIIGDAGEDLIGNTFMLVNDITYVDKGEVSAGVATGISALSSIAGSLLGSKDVKDLGNMAAAAANEFDGFTVNITSYLYRLVWDDEAMGTFYNQYWFPANASDSERRKAFDTCNDFKMEYIGTSKASAAIVTSKNFSKLTKEEQMVKACARAVDKSIVELQRSYDEFKVNVPIYSVSDDKKTAQVKIGLKEGINDKSVFVVLAPVEDENGKIHYNTVGRLKPVPGEIWDNRFGALEEAQMIEAAKAAGEKVKAGDTDLKAASLTATTFKVLSGGNQIYPGCLIREETIKKAKTK